MLLPPLPPAGHVGTILLGGEQAFFLTVMPSALSNRHTAP